MVFCYWVYSGRLPGVISVLPVMLSSWASKLWKLTWESILSQCLELRGDFCCYSSIIHPQAIPWRSPFLYISLPCEICWEEQCHWCDLGCPQSQFEESGLCRCWRDLVKPLCIRSMDLISQDSPGAACSCFNESNPLDEKSKWIWKNLSIYAVARSGRSQKRLDPAIHCVATSRASKQLCPPSTASTVVTRRWV